jgi:hypothetical protein
MLCGIARLFPPGGKVCVSLVTLGENSQATSLHLHQTCYIKYESCPMPPQQHVSQTSCRETETSCTFQVRDQLTNSSRHATPPKFKTPLVSFKLSSSLFLQPFLSSFYTSAHSASRQSTHPNLLNDFRTPYSHFKTLSKAFKLLFQYPLILQCTRDELGLPSL